MPWQLACLRDTAERTLLFVVYFHGSSVEASALCGPRPSLLWSGLDCLRIVTVRFNVQLSAGTSCCSCFCVVLSVAKLSATRQRAAWLIGNVWTVREKIKSGFCFEAETCGTWCVPRLGVTAAVVGLLFDCVRAVVRCSCLKPSQQPIVRTRLPRWVWIESLLRACRRVCWTRRLIGRLLKHDGTRQQYLKCRK